MFWLLLFTIIFFAYVHDRERNEKANDHNDVYHV